MRVVTGSGLSDMFHSTAFEVTRNLALFFVVVFWLGLAYWVYRDARRRLDDPWLVGTSIVVGLVPFLGPLVYLLFRPPETLADIRARKVELRALETRLLKATPSCPVCRSGIESNWLVCPVCTTQLKEPCVACKAPLEPLWQACPYCATPVGAQVVGAPVATIGSDLDEALTAEAAAVPQKQRRRTKQAPRRAAAS